MCCFFQDERNLVSLKLPKKNCFGKFYKQALTIAGDDEHAKPIFESFEDDLNSKFKLHFFTRNSSNNNENIDNSNENNEHTDDTFHTNDRYFSGFNYNKQSV